MILKNQALHARPSATLEKQTPRQSADPSAHNHAVISLLGIDNVIRERIILSIPNSVTSLQDFPGIAVRTGIFSNAAVAGEVVRSIVPCGASREKFHRRHASKQCRAGG